MTNHVKKIFFAFAIFIFFIYFFNSHHRIIINDDLEVVISRYNEDVNWIKEFFPREKVTIYNKGKKDIESKDNIKVIEIENVGRESHTYLYHIVKNYENLKKYVVFLQGNPFDHNGQYFLAQIKSRKIKKNSHFKSIIGFNKKKRKFKEMVKESSVNLSKNHLKNTKWKNTDFSKDYDDIVGFMRYHNIPMLDPKETMLINWGAQFIVESETIKNKPVAFYEKILSSVSRSVAPIEGHYLERLWDLVFLGEKSES